MNTTLLLLLLSACAVADISCPSGSFANGNKCTLCPPGTFQGNRNEKSCSLCSAGYFNAFRGAISEDSCAPCPAETFSEPGAKQCTPCPTGSYSSGKSYKCYKMRPGFGFDSDDFEPCPKGFYNSGTSKFCKICPSGTTANKKRGATKCTKCTPGTYRDVRYITFIRNTKCFLCPRMTYADKSGTRQCKLCPLGTFINDKGSVSCTPCPAGTFRGRVQQKKCVPCPPGTSSNGIGAAGCKHPIKGCPWHTFEDKSGVCRSCMPGERLDGRSRVCVPCGWRKVSNGGAVRSCIRCPENEQPASDETIFEKSFCECIPGYKRGEDGLCRPCPLGTYGDKMPWAFWSNFRRSETYVEPTCDDCYQSGTYGDELGQTRCKLCKRGSYTSSYDMERPKSCIQCPKGFTTDPEEPRFVSPYDSKVENGFYQCYNTRTGCPEGYEPDATGYCESVSCPSHSFAIPTKWGPYCDACGRNQFVNDTRAICQKCAEGSFNPFYGHVRRTCTTCAENEVYERDACICRKNYWRRSGVCVKCPPGKVSIDEKCWDCLTGIPVTKNGVTRCKPCSGETYKVDIYSKYCSTCPSGYIRNVDVLGQLMYGCMPRTPYGL